MKAEAIIARLGLQPHPEGGWYRQTWVGPDGQGGEVVQAVVPAGWRQVARPLGVWGLGSCTVSPGFRFEGFELAPPGWELSVVQ